MPVPEVAIPETHLKKIRQGTETILIVEDDVALLKVTQRSLEEVGYAVLPAGSPADAIRLAESHLGPIHLMVTDVIMPQMSGDRLAARTFRHAGNAGDESALRIRLHG